MMGWGGTGRKEKEGGGESAVRGREETGWEEKGGERGETGREEKGGGRKWSDGEGRDS